jgi:Fe-Mn family superoxide dismutase
MTISLMPLPYAEDALAPHVSQDTLKTHHGAHHKGYVDKVNDAVKGTPLADASLEDIVRAAKDKGDKGLFNSAAQSWNHGFYWHSMAPQKSAPSGKLAEAITRDFGSLEALNEALSKEAVGHFASGWAWLVSRDGKLEVISTHDAATALTEGVVPLLTIDVWEHAYYIDVKNKRPDYVKAVIDNCLNWAFAGENYERGTAWTYPK